MKLAKLNDWLQLITSLAVLAGLFLVYFEIRQNNVLVAADLRADAISAWQELSRLEIESDIGPIWIKSKDNQQILTELDEFKLAAYMSHIVLSLQRYEAMHQAGLLDNPENHFVGSEGYFDTDFSREWFIMRAEPWILATTPNLAGVIAEQIKDSPRSDEAAEDNR